MSYPATVREALVRTLPDIPRAPERRRRGYKHTSNHLEIDPLPVFQYGSVRGIVDAATETFPPVTGPQGRFLGAPMPIADPTQGILTTEADVLRAMTLCILYPVNLALHQLLPDGAEVTSSGEVTVGRSRFDIQWTLDYNGHRFKLAILEVKNTQMINWKEEFLPGLVTPANAQARIKEARSRENGTLLRKNAINLSRQIMKYSQSCDDIALFDWNSLTVFNFAEDEVDATPPIPTEVVHFEENEMEISAKKDVTYRLLLLGFLLRAVRRHVDLSDWGAYPREHRPTNYGRPFTLTMAGETSDSEEERLPLKRKRSASEGERFASKRRRVVF